MLKYDNARCITYTHCITNIVKKNSFVVQNFSLIVESYRGGLIIDAVSSQIAAYFCQFLKNGKLIFKEALHFFLYA